MIRIVEAGENVLDVVLWPLPGEFDDAHLADPGVGRTDPVAVDCEAGFPGHVSGDLEGGRRELARAVIGGTAQDLDGIRAFEDRCRLDRLPAHVLG